MTRELKDAIAAVKTAERLVASLNDELADAFSALKEAKSKVAKLRRAQRK